jgi:hypothetical protein
LLWLGFTPATPVEIDAARVRVATLEAHNATIVSRADALATEVADLARRASDDREALSDIRLVIDDVKTVREQVREQLTAVVAQNATLVADARASRDQVAAFATAEAGRAALLQELDRRSQRIERFLQRLSDIAGDAALDLQRPSPPCSDRCSHRNGSGRADRHSDVHCHDNAPKQQAPARRSLLRPIRPCQQP